MIKKNVKDKIATAISDLSTSETEEAANIIRQAKDLNSAHRGIMDRFGAQTCQRTSAAFAKAKNDYDFVFKNFSCSATKGANGTNSDATPTKIAK